MYLSAAIAVFLTGVTEPLEFMFMFVAAPLYAVYAVIQGAAFAMADVINLRVHSFGTIELLTRTPLALKAGLGGDLINFVLTTIGFAIATYFIANLLIKKFNFATPGRNGNYEIDGESNATEVVAADKQVIQVIHLLGGKENIKDVDACMTRLRVSVNDKAKVATETEWKKAGAMGLIVKDNGVQAVYGPKADVLKSDIEDLLQSGADIPQPEETVVQPTILDNSDGAGFTGHVHQLLAVADGEVIDITSVNDPVFSQKMMGEGYAVKPESEEVASPVDGEIISIFPTKHAIGIRTNDGIEVLVHMGIETVQMKQPASRVVVNDGQKVKAGDTLAYMDLAAVRAEGKDTTIIIVMTNSDKVDTLQLNKTGIVQKGETVGTMTV